MHEPEVISVEVVYIAADSQFITHLNVPAHSTIEYALHRSGVLGRYSELDLSVNKVGVFSKIREPDSQLNHGDRIEIYRVLQIDPKEARRQRARAQ